MSHATPRQQKVSSTERRTSLPCRYPPLRRAGSHLLRIKFSFMFTSLSSVREQRANRLAVGEQLAGSEQGIGGKTPVVQDEVVVSSCLTCARRTSQAGRACARACHQAVTFGHVHDHPAHIDGEVHAMCSRPVASPSASHSKG